jgi:DNA primase
LIHPWLLEEHAERIAALEFSTPVHKRLQTAMLALLAHEDGAETTPDERRARLAAAGFDRDLEVLDRALTHTSDRFVALDAPPPVVNRGFLHAVQLQERHVGLQRALKAAEAEYETTLSESAYERIAELKLQAAQIAAAEADEVAE